MPNNLIEITWLFLIYSFFGFCLEITYAYLEEKRFVNRGFLKEIPICPLYGHGVLLVLYLLLPIKDNLFVLFLGSIILTTVLELLTGYLLEKFFNEKWWDYSDKPFNYKGFICPRFSFAWGLGCLVVVKFIHPLILTFISLLTGTIGNIVLSILVFIYIADIIVTVYRILKDKTDEELSITYEQ